MSGVNNRKFVIDFGVNNRKFVIDFRSSQVRQAHLCIRLMVVKNALIRLCDSHEQKDPSDKLCNVYTPVFQ